MKARWPGAAERRRAIDAVLSEGGPLDPFLHHEAAAVGTWLATGETAPADRLVEILLVSPDPDDLTLRAARLLGQADTIYHAPDIPAAILDRARSDAARVATDAPPSDPPTGLSLYLRWDK